MASHSSPRLILGLRPQDALPDWITDLIILGSNGDILLQGGRKEVQDTLKVWGKLGRGLRRSQVPHYEKPVYDRARESMHQGRLDHQLLWDLNLRAPAVKSRIEEAKRDGEPLIEMNGVKVQYGNKVVLGDWNQMSSTGKEMPGLHWTIRRGQRWVIIGPNGSGKTTLLSLITSDHPQTYAMPVRLFGRSRLPEPGHPAVSIFELQSRLGHSSPEIHAFFPRQLTLRRSLESAFSSTFLSKPKLNRDRDLDVDALLRYFKAELDPHANDEPPEVRLEKPEIFPKRQKPSKKPYTPSDYDLEYADTVTFGSLSTAQQRLVLFLRALVHRPDIIILDEALSGMSPSMRDKCVDFLQRGEQDCSSRRFTGISSDQALIVISHVKEEIPDSVRQYVRLPAHFDTADDDDVLDFRIGALRGKAIFNSHVWDLVWSPARVLREHSQPGSDVDGIAEDDLIG